MPGEKVLLADDDALMLGLLSEFLSGQKYQVQTATDGHLALEAIKRENFHLALFDLRLPGLSGLELLSHLKNLSPDTEVILFTGYAGLDTAIQALRLGAYDYLLKSEVRFPELQAVVERALERRRLAQANRELLAGLQEAQEELSRRRGAELSQIRRIGETLAGHLTWELLFQGLLDLIWEGLPLAVLGLEVQGGGERTLSRAYSRREDVADDAFTGFRVMLQERLQELGGAGGATAAAPAPPAPFTAILWGQIKAEEVLCLVAAARETSFTPEEAELFRIFTLQGEAALNNLLLFEEVKNLAIRDGLTGLYNHRHFWELLEREVELARRYERPLSLIFLDIDDFKMVNDTLGHPQGDVVLKTLADYLVKTVRHADLACRYGGEEFVVILSQTPLEQALALAERLRLGISQIPLHLKGQELSITVSLGVAELAPQTTNGESLVHAADTALYRAKQAGKNRVCY